MVHVPASCRIHPVHILQCCCHHFFNDRIPIWPHLTSYHKYTFISFAIFVAAFVLLPIFWYTWIYNKGGNSNFYYAISLVYAVAVLILLQDFARSHLTHEYILYRGLPKTGLKQE